MAGIPIQFPVAEPDLSELEERYVLDALRSGWISSIGKYVENFEALLCRRTETSQAIAVSNGTTALHLALLAYSIGPGDEVIVPDLTFAATAAAVVHAGATPVIVDVLRDSWNIDPELVERAITPRTRAVIAVHLFGHPADMASLRDIASRHNLVLIEDAAEAHGARFAGRPVGGLGDLGCFSFYGNKIITTGEGGALTTNDPELAARIRFLKDHAMSRERRYYHTDVGYNYRLTNLQAAVGCAQLERFEELLERKAKVLRRYRECMRIPGLLLNPQVGPADPVCWLVCALLPGAWEGEDSLAILQKLRDEHGVESRPFFVPMHKLPPYSQARYVSTGTSIAAELAAQGICLPSSTRLGDDDVARVCDALRACLAVG